MKIKILTILVMMTIASYADNDLGDAEGLTTGEICIIKNNESWHVARFDKYLLVSEVVFLKDEMGKHKSKPLLLHDITDSEPAIHQKVMISVSVSLTSYSSLNAAKIALKDAANIKSWMSGLIVESSDVYSAKTQYNTPPLSPTNSGER